MFEYMDQDLKKHMDSTPGGLAPARIKDYIFQILSGLDFLHAHRVMHRCLAPKRLLLDRTGTIKLSGFSLARSFHIPVRAYTHEVVTLWYRAPEILLGQQRYSIPVDMWAVGAIFAEMVMRCPLVPGDSEIDELFKIFRILGTPDEDLWPGVSKLPYYRSTFPSWPVGCMEHIISRWGSSGTVDQQGLDLLCSMLVYDPSRRGVANHLMSHPYFDDVNRCLYR